MINFNQLKTLSFGAILCAGMFSGCTDLEPETFGVLVEEPEPGEDPSVLPLVTDPESVLNSTYNSFRGFTEHEGAFALMNASSDEMVVPTRGTDWFDGGVWQQLHAHTWTPLHRDVVSAFPAIATPYFRATQVIAASSNEGLISQARFIRAYYMFVMLDLYNQVPFRQAQEGLGVVPEVFDAERAISFIVEDLDAAINSLPSYSSADKGVISREAAQALLARVLLNKAVMVADTRQGPFMHASEDLARVISLSDAVLDNGQLTLQAPGTYFQQFGPDNTDVATEAIFAIAQTQNVEDGNGVANFFHMTTHYNMEVGGWNGFSTVGDFRERFDEDDERYSSPGLDPNRALRSGFLRGQQFKLEDGELVALEDRQGNPLAFTDEFELGFSNEVQGVRVMKYYPDFGGLEDPDNDLVLLRLGELYLNKAEAQLRSGNSAGALETVNQLRASRQGADALSSLDETSLLNERGFELYWEGFRRQDQIRFGTFLNEWDEKEYMSNPRYLLFPIPQVQLGTNPNLEQNPGY